MASKVISKTDWLSLLKKKPTKKIKKKEAGEHNSIAGYLRAVYPYVIFTSDSSGLRVPPWIGKALSAQRSIGKIPDLIIMQPNGKYHGLILEIKSEEASPFSKRDGKVLLNKHVVAQNKTLQRLRDLGYKAEFAVGYEGAKRIIDEYMYLK